MSLKSFLTQIWNTIQSLFNNFPTKLKASVHIGVTITENIKTIIDSPIADILTAIIPGEMDDKIKQILRKGIPIILTNLKLTDECSKLTDPQEIINCAIKHYKTWMEISRMPFCITYLY
jgi:hypothetical protein